MVEVEKTGESYIRLEEKAVSKVPTVAGTFVLADKAREIIYIGMAKNLNKALMDTLEGYNSCLTKANYFQISINPNPKEGVTNLFIEYKEEHGGFIPRCNKYDLSLGR
ncbi:MAG: hypothetical protein ABIB97_02920 [Patescibacteria group bacterium]